MSWCYFLRVDSYNWHFANVTLLPTLSNCFSPIIQLKQDPNKMLIYPSSCPHFLKHVFQQCHGTWTSIMHVMTFLLAWDFLYGSGNHQSRASKRRSTMGTSCWRAQFEVCQQILLLFYSKWVQSSWQLCLRMLCSDLQGTEQSLCSPSWEITG